MSTKKKTGKVPAKPVKKSVSAAKSRTNAKVKKTTTVKVATKATKTPSVKKAAAKSTAKPVAKPAAKPPLKTTKTAADKPLPPAPRKSAPAAPVKPQAIVPVPQTVKTEPVTAKKTPPEAPKSETPAAAKPKSSKTTLDDLALDIDEKDELLEEEKRDLAKALRDDEDEPLETAFVPTDTSERFILVVDEEGQRRNETVSIVQQILPNAVIEVADDPEEALEVMEEADFDTYVVNFLMPGFSASPFVKAVANHPDHPLLIGFAADKISDALDQRKGLKIIPLKRLFDLDAPNEAGAGKDKGEE